MPADLKELLERVEKAEGPDRELDYAVLSALPTPERGWGEIWPHTVEWNSLDAGKWAAPITASLDAALALVERVMPGWGAVAGLPARLGEHDGRPWGDVWPQRGDDRYLWASQQVRPTPYHSNAATPALALLAALLKALLSQREASHA